MEGDAHEGGLPDESFEIIKGEYEAAANGKTFNIISNSQILYDDGNVIILDIAGCEADNGILYIYVVTNGEEYYTENVFSVFYSDNNKVIMNEGSGTWNLGSNHWTASSTKVQ